MWGIENGQLFFFTKSLAKMMTFLDPLDALIPKIRFSLFAKFWVQVTSGVPGSVSVGIWGGGASIRPFFPGGGGGGSSQRAVSTPAS